MKQQKDKEKKEEVEARSPITRRIFMKSVGKNAVVGALLAGGLLSSSGCDSDDDSDYGDYGDTCGYCNGDNRHYEHCDSMYCNYGNYADG